MRAGLNNGNATSLALVTVVARFPIVWPSWVAIIELMNEDITPAIFPIPGICISAALVSLVIALAMPSLKPAINGFANSCHPVSDASIHSRRPIAQFSGIPKEGNVVASSTHRSAIVNASRI
ncbi:unannotated protein [freshwater metagenome]|uniref:Unannotated protein n=1 Tax=freshwater metagenome TaxID=449393 RepID=A0A6J6TEM1_9ZZZZ